MRGYFEVGIYRGKTPANLGTLWRSAYQLGAAGIFVIGGRFRTQPSDTTKAFRHIPLREYRDFEHFRDTMPLACCLIGIEMGGSSLNAFSHPERAIYLLGAEDHGLPTPIIDACHSVVSLESVNAPSYNVAVAGALVIYHRVASRRRKKE